MNYTFSNCKSYLKDVLSWHGYVKFLGLPTLQNNPDIPIDDLYVSQSLSYKYLSPDLAPKKEDLHNPVELLLKHRNIVVLGDPGSGKSTLINWFSWYLASGFEKKLPDALSNLLPIPIVLRDLNLNSISTFSDLISEFLKRPIAKNLSRNCLKEHLDKGQVLLLIDGLDEVGNEHKEKIRKILLAGFIGYNRCYSISTSRIVGYEEAPLDKQNDENYGEYFSSEEMGFDFVAGQLDAMSSDFEKDEKLNVTLYVAPFTENQISKFALNWYKEQGDSTGANLLKFEFLKAINENSSIYRLARTPNLLTMMALIFKVKSQLPNGRALLYNDISQAYLESIDTARKLKDPIHWQKKRFWLAKIGFEMQYRRTTQEFSSEQDLLVPHSEILKWLKEAMSINGDNITDGYAEKYLDWITKRSGLLIPRGEKLFSFLHLSFQEYFSSLYIQLQMQDPSWLENAINDDYEDEDDNLDTRVTKEFLKECGNNVAWQQPLIFLFELFDGQNSWIKRLWKYSFDSNNLKEINDYWSDIPPDVINEDQITDGYEYLHQKEPKLPNNVLLQSILLLNPHSGLFGKLKENVSDFLYRVAMVQQGLFSIGKVMNIWIPTDPLLSRLLASDVTKDFCLSKIKTDKNIDSLFLDQLNSSSINLILDEINQNSNITRLSLCYSSLENIDSIIKFSNLSQLVLHNVKISNISKITKLAKLKQLICRETNIEDFSILSKMNNLTLIDISKHKVSSIEFTRELLALRYFRASFTEVSDLTPLKNLLMLKYLILNSTFVSDITPLNSVVSLRHLNLNQTLISDISSVKNLINLENLGIHDTIVTDVNALESLEKLQVLGATLLSAADCSNLKDKPYYADLRFKKEDTV